MPKLCEGQRRVYIFPEQAPEVYVEYTIRNEKSRGTDCGESRVRLMCAMYEKDAVLFTTSFPVEKDTNYALYIQENAKKLFERPLKQHSCCEKLYKKIYSPLTPFQQYLKNHYDNIAVLNSWAASTTKKYRQTLMNQLAPQLPSVPVHRLTAEHFDAAIDRVAQQRKDKKAGDGYSDSRMEQFFSVLYSVMEYATYITGGENILKKSKYYSRDKKKISGKSIETLIKKWLKSKALTLEELKGAAACILKELDEGNSLAIGTAIQLWLPLRPSEVCGLRFDSIRYFTQPEWKNRCYFLVYLGITTERKYNSRLKTENAYRAVPIPKELQLLLERYKESRMQECHLTEAQIAKQPILLKDGALVKSNELCDVSKKILSKIMNGGSGLSEILLQPEDEEGEETETEENDTAYQYRRNGASMYVNVCGLSFEETQSLLGHDIPAVAGKRWLLNHEEALIEKMKLMDRLVLFPEPVDSMTGELCRKDPRQQVHEIDKFENFQDASALWLEAKPYSETDIVTIQLEVSAKEPNDAIECCVDAGDFRQNSNPFVFLEDKTDHRAVNLENIYLDALFDGDVQARQEKNSALKIKTKLSVKHSDSIS